LQGNDLDEEGGRDDGHHRRRMVSMRGAGLKMDCKAGGFSNLLTAVFYFPHFASRMAVTTASGFSIGIPCPLSTQTCLAPG
jgi:hypothetical protein